MHMKRILILGGGFGGVRAALDLARQNIPNTEILLVSDKHHFEYTPALYKLAIGKSPMEMCIPLGEIFRTRKVQFVVDTITGGSLAENVMLGASGSRYRYDRLVLALGAETSYFGIPGVAENSFTIKSVATALRLKEHIHKLFKTHADMTKEELMAQFQFVIVGGGPAGVELAGVMRDHTRALARIHQVPEGLVTVDILQAVPRLLPMMSEEVSRRALRQLDRLGVNVILNRPVTAEDPSGVQLAHIQLNAKTIIWTAGVRPNGLYAKLAGLSLDKGGRVLVDENLCALNTKNVYVIGDSASTPFAGTAQTAIHDGAYVARVIGALKKQKAVPAYKARKTPYVVPIGSAWGMFTYKNIVLSGRVFLWLRELIDLKFFLSILTVRNAFEVWRDGGSICESCPTCAAATTPTRSCPKF
jgi:NADH dehydrogenase